METIEEKVDSLCSPGEAIPQQRPKRKYGRFARMLGFGGGTLGILKGLIILTVTAALISTMIGTYIISQTDEIALEGRLSYDLYIDDVPMGADDYAMPPDQFTDDKLVWGETETFVHEFRSPANNGNFWVTIDQSWQTWLSDPQDEFYGYLFRCLDETDTEITQFSVMTGDPAREIKFVHTLDNHFAATPNPLPYALELQVDEYGIKATDDTFTLPATGGQSEADINVMSNDIHHTEEAWSITSVTQTGNAGELVTIVNSGAAVHFYTSHNLAGPVTFTYTISSGTFTSTATVTVHN